MKKVIGITGGIATGKSAVTAFLLKNGYEVIDADAVVRELQQIDGALYLMIRETFGADYFHENGELNREKLGALIFSDNLAKQKLAKQQDALIRAELIKRRDESQAEVVFMDIPLLFELNYTGFDEIWLIYAPRAVQIQRLMKRNGLTESDAILRIKAQMPINDKRLLATRVIENCGTIELLEEKLTKILYEI
ncbi:dephospho-CoA kinase [Lactococcus hodotermopsidis]|uniref:Dephospho-CoA kinase n=1 Tax=Pseudolactococcus hodotermopsidis TaxID=2709157 RepID=A0A6A0BBY6_9LACT|nr:dephospho-CoA kinase [Lactococcus hodotermopsidis]GFH42183.1 dephospho-CoA kinase [Lactococcus hodotermopsidis]